MSNNKYFSKRLNTAYYNMIGRCYNPKYRGYKYYGGKGVTVCKEWLDDRKAFCEWAMNNGYKENLTIDRIDNDGNYEPINCRWITFLDQQSNKTNNVFVEQDGEIKTISQWGKEIGVHSVTVKDRFEKGQDISGNYDLIKININGEIKTINDLSVESGIPATRIRDRHYAGWNDENLTDDIKINKTKYIEINGEIHTAKEWAEISGLTKNIILNRIQMGWKNEDLLKPRQRKGKKKYFEINGSKYTIDECCEIAGINRRSFYIRVKKGLNGDELIKPNSIIKNK